MTLLSEDMGWLGEAHALARRTAAIIRQNLVFAMGAIAVLVTGGLFFNLPLPLAVIGHEGGTVLVVLNGLRLLGAPIRQGGAKMQRKAEKLALPEPGRPIPQTCLRKIPRRAG